jgi:hypothetical protein
MDRNDGNQLERLVSMIEGFELPEGFTLDKRHRVMDEDGNQIAELDILVTGTVGTATIRYLIECRDRPSEGAAPRSWIEQLIGRRQSLQISKVMAVSTTGFSPGARKLAEETGVELRMLQNLTYEQVAHWLPATAPLVVRHGELFAVRLYLKTDDPIYYKHNYILSIDEPTFRRRDTGELVNIMQIWQKVMKEEAIWKDVPGDGQKKIMTIIVDTLISDIFDYCCDRCVISIGRIDFDAHLSETPSRMPIVQAASYVSQPANEQQSKRIVDLGRWMGKDTDVVREMVVLAFSNNNQKDDPSREREEREGKIENE